MAPMDSDVVAVTHLFPTERAALVALLGSLREGWRLAAGTAAASLARVAVDAETAWRLWTKGIGQDAARAAVSITGDGALGRRVLDTVAIIG
jgi:hypothetical protein